uniref:Uncharacterized protein n=1 Tax=Magallana gigas TaxID=29159 RepID=K1PNY2_MAGGI
MSLGDLNTVESVEEWAEKNGLNNHPLVVEKLEELRVERRQVCCTTEACRTAVFVAMPGLFEDI